ncbi:MAG: hypothetical protein WED05_03470 [Candidatus Atabeyarchaeum deiterrae]
MVKSNLIKIEVFDPETRGKVTVTFEGAIPKMLSESIGEYISSVLASSVSDSKDSRLSKEATDLEGGELGLSSTIDKVKFLLLKHFRYGSFSSRDLQDEFERIFSQKLRSSTVSTYLHRLSDPSNGIVERHHVTGGYEYRVRTEKVKNEVIEAEKMLAPRS